MLTFDGIMEGLDPDTALARTKKFLVDYSDLSTLDKKLKNIVPFWMWSSRNLPLIMENMWVNPGAYAKYNSLKRNLQLQPMNKQGATEEEMKEAETKAFLSEYLPQYRQEAGAFRLGGTSWYGQPELGFPGAGKPNWLQNLAKGDILPILSDVSPLFKILLEMFANRKAFSGAPIWYEDDTDEVIRNKQAGYILSQLFTPASTVARILNFVPGEKPELVQILSGAKGRGDTQAFLSWMGSPIWQNTEETQRREVWNRYYDVKELYDKYEKLSKKAEGE
jgi:hypothetical protein